MKKFITYDLEACFLKKGFKRNDTKLLEIGLYNDEVSFETLVNPLSSYSTGDKLLSNLDELNQHPENTINFWTKLLIGKKGMETKMKRRSVEEKADAISTLLCRSDIAITHDNPGDMMLALKRHNDDEEKAKDDVRTGEVGFKQTFMTAEKACQKALDVGKDYIWVAHNGTSFDEKILKGHQDHDWSKIKFLDSIPIIKKWNPGLKSYAQTEVYHHLFNKSYFAHHALQDAKALYKIMSHILEPGDLDSFLSEKKTKVKTHKESSLYDLPNIGKKSVERLHKDGITSSVQLLNIVQTLSFEAWCKKFSYIHRHKDFYRKWKHHDDRRSAFV